MASIFLQAVGPACAGRNSKSPLPLHSPLPSSPCFTALGQILHLPRLPHRHFLIMRNPPILSITTVPRFVQLYRLLPGPHSIPPWPSSASDRQHAHTDVVPAMRNTACVYGESQLTPKTTVSDPAPIFGNLGPKRAIAPPCARRAEIHRIKQQHQFLSREKIRQLHLSYPDPTIQLELRLLYLQLSIVLLPCSLLKFFASSCANGVSAVAIPT